MHTPLSMIDVTSRKEKQFNTKNIFSVEELCEFLPIGYRDYTNISKIRDIKEGDWVSVYGEVIDKVETSKIFSIVIKDNSNGTLKINWFASYHYEQIDINEKYMFCGKISSYGFFKKELCMNVPEAYSYGSEVCKIMPRYSTIKGMAKDYLSLRIHLALEYLKNNPSPADLKKEEIAKSFNIQSRLSALLEIHNPTSKMNFKMAKRRLNFDILYDFYSNLIIMESCSQAIKRLKLKSFKQMELFIKTLPFELTEGQSKAIKRIKDTLIRGERLNSLLLGDVGSGKTIIAVSLAVGFCENKYQVAMLSPTQVLATQNYNVMRDYLEPLGYKVAFISSNSKVKEKRELLKGVLEGNIDVLVGTHSVLSDNVEFKNLGLTIVDEEHRFGVLQKEAMAKKITNGVNNLSMSATPIPRSLALSIYGNGIDVLIVNTMPKGRIPILTKQYRNMDEVYGAIKREVTKGRQCYIVCPLIEDSESELFANIDSVNSVFEEVSNYFKDNKGIKIEKISGNMKSADIEESLSRFSSNESNILISTTIVEVGVNVPNASLIVVKNAERFGLAQLHQLRGRVGRGKYQSYCYLVSDHDKERLDILCKTLDGFKIAEEDLRLRGAGKLTGVLQTGYSNEIATVISHPKLAHVIEEKLREKTEKCNQKIAI